LAPALAREGDELEKFLAQDAEREAGRAERMMAFRNDGGVAIAGMCSDKIKEYGPRQTFKFVGILSKSLKRKSEAVVHPAKVNADVPTSQPPQ
jgi:hypothetical protein